MKRKTFSKRDKLIFWLATSRNKRRVLYAAGKSIRASSEFAQSVYPETWPEYDSYYEGICQAETNELVRYYRDKGFYND